MRLALAVLTLFALSGCAGMGSGYYYSPGYSSGYYSNGYSNRVIVVERYEPVRPRVVVIRQVSPSGNHRHHRSDRTKWRRTGEYRR